MPTSDLASGVTTICKYAFDHETVQRGLDYHAQGRVLSSNALLHKDNLHIHATVRGRQPKPYLVEARLFRRQGGVRIEAICTCPFGINCKHAVAAIADIFGKDGMKLFATHSDRVTLEEPETVVEAPPEPLPSHYAGWLASLRAAPAQSVPSKTPLKTIVYRLDVSSYRGLEVHILQCSPLKSGALGKASPWRSQQLDEDSPYPSEDLAILRELAGMSYKSDTYALRGAFGTRMLQRLIATGKCHWKTVRHDAPLKPGLVRCATLDWATAPNGTQTPTMALQPPADNVLTLDQPIYIDTATGECGGIDSPHSQAVIRQWLAAPPVGPRESRAVAAQVRTLGLPAPREIAVVERHHAPFTPVLKLMHVHLRRAIYSWEGPYRHQSHSELDIARLEFDYAGQRVGHWDDDECLAAFKDGRVETIQRNLRQEGRAYDHFCDVGPVPLDEIYSCDIPEENQDDFALPSPADWLRFMNDVVPDLRQRGWIVEIDPGFHYQFATVQDWYSQTTTDATVNDWFSFELGILVDGQPINLLPMIRDVLDQLKHLEAQAQIPESIDLKLPDGRFVQLPAQRVLDIGKTLAELYDPAALVGDRLQVSRLRAAELVDLPGLGQWKGAEELRTLARRLGSYQGITRLPPPAGLNATLRPYQLDGLSWLQFLREYSFGGILADDMGLGKTVQVLAHLVLEKESGRANLPSLVVAPTSLMANWRAETQRFAPGLRVHVSHGGDRKEHFERLADFDLIVTSYSLLPRDEEILKGQPFHLLILDEAQYVKNPNTKWADVARSLSARHRLCMTGTPMENHLGELWSLMTFLSPGYLGTQKQFSRVYRSPIEKAGETDRRKHLAQRVRPFILRRRKEEVALDLPPKTEITRAVELEGPQRDLYETVRLAMHQRVQDEIARRGMDRSHIIILDALLKLRQICCDPRLVKLDSARKVKESAKLELLMDMLPKMTEEGRRVLVFSQFTSMLDLIEPEITKRNISFVRLDGSTADRATPVERFQAGEVSLFLISLKAGGTGLNLTAADTVIHYDPWWNPAVEQQATDRAHRIGQDKPVFVYKLVTQGTVEEKIVAMQDRKRELVSGLLDDGAQQNLQLSKEDLDHLFDPIG